MQILGVFASRGNVKAAALSKVVLEATLLCEQAGLFVDGVTCDAASWNRSMWKLFGIRGTFKHNAPRAGNVGNGMSCVEFIIIYSVYSNRLYKTLLLLFFSAFRFLSKHQVQMPPPS
ncbi:hypothetical protein HPB48_010753 [Haemaphysalis longicornis]|uniref:Transposable element P transposase-like RNase H domain-containing protein n=1 Tax=Haemaphysalis longicornis TaxID=44386 RepID=A0A9J6GLC6_HAELO|nr:hypothetical protein HPB48_010753 [Haemaphysalis longicornis]